MTLPDELVSLLSAPAICFVTTLMPDGSPQVTQTWVDTDGEHVLVNIVQGSQKSRNVARDARVAVGVCSTENPSRYVAVRGEVVSQSTDGATEHIEKLAQKYLGGPYPWYGGRDQVRELLLIRADKITRQG